MKNKRDRKKSEKPTPEESRKLLETFSPEEQSKIHQLVADLKKIRKIDTSSTVSTEKQIEDVLEQQYFYVGSFLLSEGWNTDKAKALALWNYLKLQFS